MWRLVTGTRACTFGYAAFRLLADIFNALATTSIDLLCRLLRLMWENWIDGRPLETATGSGSSRDQTVPRLCINFQW